MLEHDELYKVKKGSINMHPYEHYNPDAGGGCLGSTMLIIAILFIAAVSIFN